MAAPVANYPNENEGPTILATTLTVTALALVTLAVRLYVRVKMIRNVGWDDYTMIFAMVLIVAGQIIIIPEVHYGAGKHINHIAPADFSTAFKLNFITQPIFLWAICIVKLSIGFFLLRVAATPFFRRIIIGVMTFMGLYTLGCFFTLVLQCTNLAVQWDPKAKGTCWSTETIKALSYVNVACNITTDLLFAIIIPIPMLWGVQMNRRTKGSVLSVLALGVFATIAALVKLTFLPNYGRSGDWMWDSRNLTIWTVVESDIGIIAGNLPCMKPLFRRVLGSMYGRGSAQRSKYGRYGTGTNGRSVQNYNSLSSSAANKAHDASAYPAYGQDDGHMMTRITARPMAGSQASLKGDADSKISDDSDRRLNIAPQSDKAIHVLGGITKTTNVTTKVSFGGATSRDDMERKEAHLV